MFRTVAASVCAAAALSLAVAPSASAAGEPAPVSIDINPGHAMYWNSRGWWEVKASFGRFSVDITDIGGEDLDETTIFVSIPPEIDISRYEGDGWNCWDVDGGVECHNGHVVVPGEAWPRLDLGFDVDHMTSPDSIDVYATTGDFGPAHEGIPFKTDTSI